ncbi:MAG: hypothetical protein MJY82_09510 [Fibrobacter sp.]|nr:hypothetical protein [Fibrobacter sp.]
MKKILVTLCAMGALLALMTCGSSFSRGVDKERASFLLTYPFLSNIQSRMDMVSEEHLALDLASGHFQLLDR